MIENDLDKVLNYMKRYVENVYEHDSEIMLNWKDIKLVLEEIYRLNKELEVAKTNEETYRLEMLDITKRLGLDELTLFDDVKDKAERLLGSDKE